MSNIEYEATAFGQIQFERSNLELVEEVKEIDRKLTDNPAQPRLWMERGLALHGKQKLNREAAEAYSMGLTYNPFDSLLYRHRGHTCLNIGRYIEGAADLEMSVRIDPTNWDSWYHLGLAYYLLEDYVRSKKAFQRCLEYTYTEDKYVAVVGWYWIALKHLGKDEAAAASVACVTNDSDVGDNKCYWYRTMVYNGSLAPETAIDMVRMQDDHMFGASIYGIACYYEFSGEMEKSRTLLEEIVSRREDTWCGFAKHAARLHLNRLCMAENN